MSDQLIVLLIWLFPVFFMIHDFEEIVIVEKWVAQHKNEILTKLPKRAANFFEENFAMKTYQFSWIVFLEFVLISIATVWVYMDRFTGMPKWIYLSLFSILFFHSFTHIGQALILKRYTPGVITSVFILIPYGLYFYLTFVRLNLMQPIDIVISLVSGVFVFALIFPKLHKIAATL